MPFEKKKSTYTLRVVNYVHSDCIDGNQNWHIAVHDPGGQTTNRSLDLSSEEGSAITRQSPTKFQILAHEFARIGTWTTCRDRRSGSRCCRGHRSRRRRCCRRVIRYTLELLQ